MPAHSTRTFGRRLTRLASVALLGVLLAPSNVASAHEHDFLLVDEMLRSRVVRVAEVNAAALVIIDRVGQETVIPRRACLALVRDDRSRFARPARSTTTGMLMFADGQRIPGVPAPGAAINEDAMLWQHPWLDQIAVPFDAISAAVFEREATLPESATGDVVQLRNGDRLEGFLTQFGTTLGLELEGSPPREIEIPLDRVRAIRLVTEPRERMGTRAWFRDGSVIDTPLLTLADDGYVHLDRPAGAVGRHTVRIEEITALRFDGGDLLPLSTLTPRDVSGPPERYFVPEPAIATHDAPLNARAIEFRGPVTVSYRLPNAVNRFAASVELPDDSRNWGDLELVIRDGGVERVRVPLNADSPRADINIELTSRSFEVELLAGKFGPIQDRVIMRRALFMVETSE